MRKESLCNRNLAERGFSRQLDVVIIKNGGTVIVSEKMMATAVEAILGAVHLDGGLDALTTVMENLGIIDPLRESVTCNPPSPCGFLVYRSAAIYLRRGVQVHVARPPQVSRRRGMK